MKLFAIAVLGSILFACNTNPKDSYSSIQDVSGDMAMATPQEHPGKKLMENNCYACHNPKASEENMIAPPFVAVKMHYISGDTSKEDFIKEMIEWSKQPSEEKSKMPGAINKFGLMPYQFFPEETISQIADYMFDNEIEEPVWFGDHYNKMQGDRPMMKGKMGRGKGMGMNKNQANTNKQLSVEERGMEMALTTKAELGKNLIGQIQKNGVIAALDFCNVQALPITDSMATVYKAHIKRVTDKPRNPKNKANAAELQYLENFKKQVATGVEVKPITVQMGNKTEFYYPIVTNSMCLKCHGNSEKELEIPTLNKIKELYPTDMATGYNENEVRGIWSIGFEN
ncbi:Tll0287-like domain-containing protein [Aequorivita antarctica]|uniref:Tll0287-like domain-containing protein n=1 Tax=Aequorivita antarctica TaxID=153266 RepID=UPI000DBBDC9C|nr:DUF3365 domain-containing protein [Aequorivita antarctica]SRX72947.1 hypothetical protein AEQU3_00580 [Aequorivita antarctica]